MAQVAIECLYCGKKWRAWVYGNSLEAKCADCGETSLLKAKEIQPQDSDPYGYNHKGDDHAKDTKPRK